jgi:hypothetical protein
LSSLVDLPSNEFLAADAAINKIVLVQAIPIAFLFHLF